MLIDYTLKMTPGHPIRDANALKTRAYHYVKDIGVSVDPRAFIYGRCPVDERLIFRSEDEKLARVSTEISPVPQPQVGEEYDFCLRATPTHGHHKQPAEPRQWLNGQVDKLGIKLVAVAHQMKWLWCGKGNGTAGFYLPDVVYLGRLLVTDPDKLTTALASGIGRHKAFGFGLLQLYPEN